MREYVVHHQIVMFILCENTLIQMYSCKSLRAKGNTHGISMCKHLLFKHLLFTQRARLNMNYEFGIMSQSSNSNNNMIVNKEECSPSGAKGNLAGMSTGNHLLDTMSTIQYELWSLHLRSIMDR